MRKAVTAVTALCAVAVLAGAATAGAGYTHTTTTTTAPTTTTAAPTTTTTCPDCTPNTVVATTTTSSSTTVAPTTTTSSSTTSSSTTTAPTTTTSSSTTSSSTTTVAPTTTSTTAAPTTSTTTSSTLPETFTFGAAGTVCVAEVPTIRITFQTPGFPSLAGQTGELRMTDVNGITVDRVPVVYQPGATVDVLYPGTAVNPDGTIADVPGWNLNAAGFWVPDASDAFLREGVFLIYTVNPTAGPVLVTYPPESSTCANPDGPFGPAPLELPATR